MIVARNPSARPRLSAALTVCSVAWPLTNNVRAKLRTIFEPSSEVIVASPDHAFARSLAGASRKHSGWLRVREALCSGRLRCRRSGHVRLHHLLRIDDPVEFGFGDKAKFERRILESEVIVHRIMCDLRRLVVGDYGRKRRHDHHGTLDVFGDVLQVGPAAFRQYLSDAGDAARPDGG